MADTLVFLQLEHRALLRMLHLIEDMCAILQRRGPVDGEFLTLVLDYFRDYPDTCHHPKEDLVLRHVQDRDPRAAHELLHVLGDHEELHDWTVEIAERAHLARRSRSLHDPGFVDELRRFAERYHAHLDDEDSNFFPVVRKCLKREDWDLIDFTMFDGDDPLYDPRAENRFRDLRTRIFDTAEGGFAPGDEARN